MTTHDRINDEAAARLVERFAAERMTPMPSPLSLREARLREADPSEPVAWRITWPDGDQDLRWERPTADAASVHYPEGPARVDPLYATPLTAPVAPQSQLNAAYDAIEQVLLHHRLCGLVEAEDEGSNLSLVDHLCTPGSADIGSGRHEIRLICDAIYSDEAFRAALATPPQTPSPVAPARAQGEAQPTAQALRDLIRAYVNLLESGRERILFLGGECDPVDVMERSDPHLRAAKAALATPPQGQADRAPCREEPARHCLTPKNCALTSQCARRLGDA